jgi:hypothetical protein
MFRNWFLKIKIYHDRCPESDTTLAMHTNKLENWKSAQRIKKTDIEYKPVSAVKIPNNI